MSTAWVLGGKGFIGRHLSLYLSRSGIQATGIGHGAWPEADAGRWGNDHWLNGDISQSNLDHLARTSGLPNMIFQLAGGSSVGVSLETPKEDFERSVGSNVHLLEWVRACAPQCRVVLASSAAVYGNGHCKPIRETDRLSPYSPYGYHKRMSELLFESYSRNFGLLTSVVRLFSVYGPELRKQLLWDLCKRFQRKPESIVLQGTGSEARDWIQVNDAVRYLHKAANFANSEGFVINGGGGSSTSVREVAEFVRDIWGLKTALEFNGASRPGDPSFLVADIELALSIKLLAEVSWHDGVRDYVQWFQKTEGLTA